MADQKFEVPGLGKAVYVTGTGMKLGSKGKVGTPSQVLSMIPKGPARHLRKALKAAGHSGYAAARRVA